VIHLRRYFTALAVLLVLCCTYAVAVVPWIEPPPLVKAEPVQESLAIPAISAGVQEELARLFPPDAWQRKDPKVVETEQCTLLIQDYRRLPDGGLELKPCTLIFHASGGASDDGDQEQRGGRPIVLDAPLAEIKFDRPLNLARAEFGRVEKGTLSGEITIYSPPTSPTSDDALFIRTRAVWLDRQSIRTANDVEFQYGASSGRGRDLEIAMLQQEPGKPRVGRPRLGGMQSITLKKLEYLRIATTGNGLFGGAAGQKADAGESATLEITCQDEFVFDVPGQLARFVKRVEVRRLVAGLPPDLLRCDELLLAFDQRKQRQSAAAMTDPIAGRLARVIAIGSPAVLEAPSRGVQAVAAHMEYSLAEDFVVLKSSADKNVPQVSLRQFGQHFVAPELHYQLADEGRLGRLRAAGPGELRLLQGRGRDQQIVTARWGRELQIQPQDRDQVISLLGQSCVTVDPLGRFDASELHLWVTEMPVDTTPDPTAAAAKPKTTILPLRLLAVGSVRLISPQLDADTDRLEAWFTHLPPELPQQPPPAAPPGIIREPIAVQQASFSPAAPPQAAIRDVIRPPNLQKFRVGGGAIQMQLVVRGRQFDLEDLNIRERAAIDETRTPEPGQEPIRLRGDLLELRHGTQPDATLVVTGQPSEVAGRGMSLAGGKIEVFRSENLLRINGPGEATMPAERSQWGQGSGDRGPVTASSGQGAQPTVPAKMHIVWQEGLTFDGLVARCAGGVEIRTATQTALAPALDATLGRRIDFQATSGQPQAELARVFLDGGTTGVYVESRTFDDYGAQISREQLRARNVSVDQIAGTLHAAGPGWVSSVRKSSGLREQGAGNAGQASVISSQEPESLTCIHVAFEREIAGELKGRWIEFRQQVQTTYSPANSFSDLIVANPLQKMSERMMLMTSDTLRVTEMISPPARWFELLAAGGTKIEGDRFHVDAPKVGYVSDKEWLTIQGDGRADARIWVTRPEQKGNWAGQKLRYNLRTGELQNDVARSIHIELGPNTNLPIPSVPATGRGKK
jgi:hypothetical protein